MKKILVILTILILIFVTGCGNKTTEEEKTTEPITMPDLNQVQPEIEDVPSVIDDTEINDIKEEELTPIGNRITDSAEEISEEDEKEEITKETPEEKSDDLIITLNVDKTISSSEETISKGDTVIFKNEDTFPHLLMIEKENPDSKDAWDRTILVHKGDRIEGGNSWSYTFNEKGDFTVRDTFAGKMRTVVIVE